MLRLVFALGLVLIATPALSDPCTRIPDRGPMPAEVRTGQTFAGPVVYVGDGDSLCVETIPDIGGAGWVEVRLADFRAIELNAPGGRQAREALIELAMRRRVVCVARNRTYDRVAADCTIGGNGLGYLMRRHGIAEGGR